MLLSARQTTDLLDALNTPAALDAFERVAGPELRAAWVAAEDAPFDTTGSEMRQAYLSYLEDLIADLRRADRPGGHPLIVPADFYFYTGEGAGRGGEPGELPVMAYKIRQTVLWFSPDRQRWLTRPWLGADADMLLRLPYSRKYDRERALQREREENRIWEALQRARDLIGLYMRRVDDVRVARDPYARLDYPELSDIQAELALDGLLLGRDDFGLLAGELRYELFRLHTAASLRRPRPDGPPLAVGSYTGALTQLKTPSPASAKAMALRALDALREDIFELLHPLDDESDAENCSPAAGA